MKVLITGGASGLGAALVAACAARGDAVTVLDIAAAPPDAAAMWLCADLADPAAVSALAPALAQGGPFDLVVACAGLSATGPFEDQDAAAHPVLIAVNLTAPALVLAHLLQTGGLAPGGRVVLVSSLSYFTGYPGAAVYGGTKDGLVALARALRKPLWRAGRIAIHALAPGPMDTPHAARYAPPGASGKGRIAPEAVAEFILRLRGRALVPVPGAGARMMAGFGRLAPGLATRAMRRIIYDKYPRKGAP
jgi:cyclic-di-GMP-binding biofilm dispersal mediator protein